MPLICVALAIVAVVAFAATALDREVAQTVGAVCGVLTLVLYVMAEVGLWNR